MKKYFYSVVISFVIVFNLNLFPQAPEILWTRTFGSTSADIGHFVQETDDRGYIIAGSTNIPGTTGTRIRVIKTDSTGNPIWSKVYGDSVFNEARCVNQTSDGGYIITGTVGFGIDTYAFLLRIDEAGNTLWQKIYGYGKIGYFTEQCSDGGFIVAGSITFSSNLTKDILVIKTDSFGNVEWQQSYGGNSNEEAYCIRKVYPTGYIVSGITDSYGSGSYDAWILRIDNTGNQLWARTYGGTLYDVGYSISQTSDGGFIVSGSLASSSYDAWLIKLNNAGDSIWTRTYGKQGNQTTGKSVQQTVDNGFIITGSSYSTSSSFDVVLIRTNEIGDTLWTKLIGGIHEDQAESVYHTYDGGYVLVGWTYSFGSGLTDIYLIRVDSDINTTDIINFNSNSLNSFQLYQNYPNPFNPTTKINWQSAIGSWQTLKIFDVLGNEVATLVDEYKPAGEYEVEFNAASLPSGVYFYQLTAGEFIQTKKLMLMK